jgi:hypothetical protein
VFVEGRLLDLQTDWERKIDRLFGTLTEMLKKWEVLRNE